MQRVFWPCCKSTRIAQPLIVEVENPISETTPTFTASNSSSEAVEVAVFSHLLRQVAIISMAPAKTINSHELLSKRFVRDSRPQPGRQTRMTSMEHMC